MTEPVTNRAARRSMRRKSGMVGLSMLATTGLLGAYLGNPRLPRSYAVGTQCGPTVTDLPTLGAALSAFGSQTTPCDTITVGADIQWANFGTLSGSVPLTIDGQGHTLTPYTFGGSPGALSVELPMLTVKDVTFTTFTGAPVISSTSGTDVTLDGVTFTQNTGGVLALSGGDISITDSVFDDNDQFGGLTNTVTLDTADSVAITHSTFTGNTAGLTGGVYISRSKDTLAVPSTITDSYFANNVSTYSAGAVFSYNGELDVTGSTFSGNTGDLGGAIRVSDKLVLLNSTLSGNSAATAGGAIHASGDAEVVFSTLSGNTSPKGNVLYGYYSASTFTNSIVTNPGTTTGYDIVLDTATVTASNSSFRQGSLFYDGDYGPTTFVTDGVAGNQVGQDPLLGALGDNGGFLVAGSATVHIPTMLPGATSPVLDAGVAGGSDPSTDERGTGYARSLGTAPDMGAVEVQASVDMTVTVTPSPASPSITYGASTPALTPSYSGYSGSDAAATAPVCKVYLQGTSTEVTTTPLPAGTYDTQCSGGSAGTGYQFSYAKGSLTVTKAATAVTYTGTTGSLGAGGALTLSSTVSPVACTGTVTYELDDDPTGGTTVPFPLIAPVSTAGWAAGTYTVTASYASDSNCDAGSDTGSLTITSATTVMVTPYPSTKSIKYGYATPSFRFKAAVGTPPSAFTGTWTTTPTCAVAPDPRRGVSGSYDPETPGPILPVGTYPVVCTGGVGSAGETVVYVDGILTVTPAYAVKVYPKSATWTVGQTPPALGFTASGFKNSETFASPGMIAPTCAVFTGVGGTGTPVTISSATPTGTYYNFCSGAATTSNYTSPVQYASDGVVTVQPVVATTITRIKPNYGYARGGTKVYIYGTGFAAGTTVSIGGVACTRVSVNRYGTQITCYTGAHAAGLVDVVVTAPGGTATLTSGYRYK